MSILASSLRPFWTPGINTVSGNVTGGVQAWLAEEKYQIYSPVEPTLFVIQTADPNPFLLALASDINKAAVACYESIRHVLPSPQFPRSMAWSVIKTYYSAFFGAHAILRMLGTPFTSLDKAQAASVSKIAKLHSALGSNTVEAGSYAFTYDSTRQKITWKKVESSGGIHGTFWAFFNRRTKELSDELLRLGTGSFSENQLVSIKLADLSQNLCHDSSPKGTWLSNVRNAVNYRYSHGAWYPYTDQASHGQMDSQKKGAWLSDPMTINLSVPGINNIRRFQDTCSFIIGACRELTQDMAARCSTGKSFHTYGWLAVSNLTKPKGTR
jgi:hypothetical protein